jgi:methionyl-tRNA formyltransferase
MRIVFMGTAEFAVPSLKRLVEEGYNVVGVVTAPDKPSGRGLKINKSHVKVAAEELGLNILQPEKLKSEAFVSDLKALNADLQIVVAFRMLPEVVWSMPKEGTFNLHSSLLPKYRGAAPINWAIINGDKESGVTTFFLKHEIDTGNIIFQDRTAIDPEENVGSLYARLMHMGGELTIKTVKAILDGTAQPFVQDESGDLRHAPKIFKEDCKIDWTKSLDIVHNFTRGLSPYPVAWTELEGKNLRVFKAHREAANHQKENGTLVLENKELKVAVNGGYFVLDEIQIQGKKRMKTTDFLNGFQLKEGTIL